MPVANDDHEGREIVYIKRIQKLKSQLGKQKEVFTLYL